MRKFFLFVLAISIGFYANSQTMKQKELLEIKTSKTIVGLTDDDKVNEYLKNAIKEYWSFNEVVEYLPLKEAKKKAKENDNLVVMSIGTDWSTSSKHGNGGYQYRTVSSSRYIGISRGKGYSIIFQNFPEFKDKNITPEVLDFAVSSLQYLCETMDEHKLKTNWKYKEPYKEHSKELQKKTLYLPEHWIDQKNITKEKLKELYNYPVEIVSYEKWAEAITSKEKGIAYCMIVPVSRIGDIIFLHYLVDAETGTVYAISTPKAVVKVAGINMSKANSDEIIKKNIKKYNKAAKGDW